MFSFLFDGPPHPWPSSYIRSHDLDELVEIHNEIYYYLQGNSTLDIITRRVRITASKIQEWLEENGAVRLSGGLFGGVNVNMQLSVPAQSQPQQGIIMRQQEQPQMQVQQPAQQDIIYRQQASLQPTVGYQQPQQQPQALTIPAPAATLTLTSAPVQNVLIGRIGTPVFGYVGRPRRFRARGLYYYSSDSD